MIEETEIAAWESLFREIPKDLLLGLQDELAHARVTLEDLAT